jgi:hypothetical protein
MGGAIFAAIFFRGNFSPKTCWGKLEFSAEKVSQ